MRKLTATTATAAALLLTACTGQPTQEEIGQACVKVIRELGTSLRADAPRPAECEGLTEDNYKALLMAEAIDDLGVDTDKNGTIEPDELSDFAENG